MIKKPNVLFIAKDIKTEFLFTATAYYTRYEGEMQYIKAMKSIHLKPSQNSTSAVLPDCLASRTKFSVCSHTMAMFSLFFSQIIWHCSAGRFRAALQKQYHKWQNKSLNTEFQNQRIQHSHIIYGSLLSFARLPVNGLVLLQ